MAMSAFVGVVLKKQWVPTHMVRIMLVYMPVTLQRYIQNKEKTNVPMLRLLDSFMLRLYRVQYYRLYKSRNL